MHSSTFSSIAHVRGASAHTASFARDRGFRVEGAPPDDAELEEALRAAGARTGSEVEVGEETFELA